MTPFPIDSINCIFLFWHAGTCSDLSNSHALHEGSLLLFLLHSRKDMARLRISFYHIHPETAGILPPILLLILTEQEIH